MLSIERCRELVGGNAELNDDEIAELRAQLYGLAEVVVATVSRAQAPVAAPDPVGRGGFRHAMALVPFDLRVDVEERAAIAEFDGGLGREESEQRALLTLVKGERGV